MVTERTTIIFGKEQLANIEAYLKSISTSLEALLDIYNLVVPKLILVTLRERLLIVSVLLRMTRLRKRLTVGAKMTKMTKRRKKRILKRKLMMNNVHHLLINERRIIM